jgi:hypothetical protein
VPPWVLAQKLLLTNLLAQRKLLELLELLEALKLLAPLAQVLQARSIKIYPQWVVALV